jgi:uncharacterized protein YdcH (DUF465 family)
MEEKNEDLIQRLSEENPRFRKLHEEHLLFEKKLQELKLAGKDEMESILRDCRQ